MTQPTNKDKCSNCEDLHPGGVIHIDEKGNCKICGKCFKLQEEKLLREGLQQPTNTDYKSMEEMVEEFAIYVENELSEYHQKTFANWLIVTYAKGLQERDRIARQEEREIERSNFAKVLESLRDIVDGTDRMLEEYIDDTIVGLTLTTPNDKE